MEALGAIAALVLGFWVVTGELGVQDTNWETVCEKVGGTWVEDNRPVGECVKE